MDSDWLGRLVDRYAAALELYARQWCHAPEDVVQEAFLKLVAQRPLPDQPAAWLIPGGPEWCTERGARGAETPSSRSRGIERRRRVWFQTDAETSRPDSLDAEAASTALQSLPLEQREAIVAHLWGGLTFEQIGELSGCSASTAHRQYVAGLAAIRERLGVTCRKSRPIQN